VDTTATPGSVRDPGHTVGGLDGCRGGWVLASLTLDHTLAVRGLAVEVVPTFAEAADRVVQGGLEALAVDMPIGLSDGAPRLADQAARRRLGRRGSSIFATPVRATLEATDYADALAISRRVCGKGLSKQAFNLLPRIGEVDRVVTPERQDRIFECHPELAFAGLAGAALAHSKHTPEGIEERIGLLAGPLGGPGRSRRHPDAVELVGATVRGPRRGARPDDALDALVIALVAAAVAADHPGVEHLGDGARDRRGLRMEIVTRSDPGFREVPCND
jgi:predicted RNase H-like nuclease